MKKQFTFLRVATAAILLSSLGFAYTLQWSSGAFLKWPATAKVTMYMNLNFPVASAFNSPFLVQSVIQHVEREWNATLQAQGIGVRYVDGGSTKISDVGCDSTNVVTFTDTQFPLPAGVLAFAVITPSTGAGLFICGKNPDGTPNIVTADFAGQILDADITLNRNLVFSPYGMYTSNNPPTVANDIEATILHEMGHVLGLHHSGIIGSVMVPGSQQVAPSRTLTSDEIAGINAAYGVNALGGAISGKVVDGTGAPVIGAHVVLTSATTGLTTVGAISDPTGQYSMVGFAPGSYKVWVEPLNKAPVNINVASNFPPLFANPTSNFNPALVGTVTVAKGTAATQNITVSTTPNASVFLSMGVILYAKTFIGSQSGASVSAPRGNLIGICAYGTNLAGDITLSAPASLVVPTATTSSNVDARFCPGGQYSRTFQIDPATPPGVYDVYMNNAMFTGALTISTNPQIFPGGVTDGAAFTKGAGAYAAGGFISIFGTDFALSDNLVSDYPVPTQLGGVSVRVGDRFAPIFYAGAGQINAMIPYEVTGTVDVQVQTGDASVADYGNITVSASAPRIFTASQTGAGQGAILNQDFSANSSSNPAAGGSIIQVFCMGLGQTTPAAITGIAVPPSIGGGAAQVAVLPTVTIGGKVSPSVGYAGIAPTYAGLYQVNAVVPTGLGTQAASIVITDAAGNKSNPGQTVTVAVK